MAITAQEARAELARREIARRQSSGGSLSPSQSTNDKWGLVDKAMRYGVKDPLAGILTGAKELGNIPHKIFSSIPAQPDYDWGKELGVENPEAADKLIQFAGQYGPSLAIPGVGLGRAGQALSKIPAVGRFASKALSEAIPQGLYSASQAPQEAGIAGAETAATTVPFSILSELMKSTDPKVKYAAKILSGAGGAYLGREGAKSVGSGETLSDLTGLFTGALGARGFNTKKQMMERLTEGVSPDVSNPRIKAANQLGLDYLTPAEAGVSPWAAKRQGSLGRTEEGGQLLYEKGLKRQESEKRAIDKTLEQIYSDKLNPVVEEAYQKLKPVNLPTDFPVQYQNNSIINAAERRVKNRPAYQESLKKYFPENVKLKEGQSNIEPTSLVYWDHIKRALYDMGKEAERKGSGSEANIINETRRDLVNQMDTNYPEYAEARALYERKKVREGLEKVFDRKAVNGTNFYRALESDRKFDELMGSLRNVPEAQENLKAMRMVFKDLMGPPTIKTAKGTEERGMNQFRAPAVELQHILEHMFTRGGNDKAAIAFITSKDWMQQLEEIKKISNKQERLAALTSALGRGVGQYVGHQERKPLEIEFTGGHR